MLKTECNATVAVQLFHLHCLSILETAWYRMSSKLYSPFVANLSFDGQITHFSLTLQSKRQMAEVDFCNLAIRVH